MTYDDGQRHTMTDNERRTVDGNDRDTEQQHTGEWSKISTQLENGLLLKNAAQIFRATAENWASRTHRAAHTAHSKHSKSFYALLLRSANSQHSSEVLQTACRAFYSVVFALISVACVWLFDYGRTQSSGKYI